MYKAKLICLKTQCQTFFSFEKSWVNNLLLLMKSKTLIIWLIQSKGLFVRLKVALVVSIPTLIISLIIYRTACLSMHLILLLTNWNKSLVMSVSIVCYLFFLFPFFCSLCPTCFPFFSFFLSFFYLSFTFVFVCQIQTHPLTLCLCMPHCRWDIFGTLKCKQKQKCKKSSILFRG